MRAVLVFDVVYRWDGWAGLLVAPLLWKLAWYLHAVKVSPGATATLSLCALSGQLQLRGLLACF